MTEAHRVQEIQTGRSASRQEPLPFKTGEPPSRGFFIFIKNYYLNYEHEHEEFENLKRLQHKVLLEPLLRWSELTKLDEIDRQILVCWKLLKFPGSLECWFDLLIEQYSKRGTPLYKRALRWQVSHFVKVMKNYERKSE